MAVAAAIDDLFRQKTLHEIHAVLKQTRDEVDSKKQELRELVGNHYRSVLESSDHIRAMSGNASAISTGAERIDDLIASMRSLASNPCESAVGYEASENLNEDHHYRLGSRVMSLMELPENVRSHLSANEFAEATRLATVDAAAINHEVCELIKTGEADKFQRGDVDLPRLVREQSLALEGLPAQIAASCTDSFGMAGLSPAGAAAAFVVNLLLKDNAQPIPLIQVYFARRAELIGSFSRLSRAGASAGGCAARLAGAVAAIEGTVVLGCGLCHSVGSRSTPVNSAIDAVAACLPDMTAEEERALIEGRSTSGMRMNQLRLRVDSLRKSLLQKAGSELLVAEFSRLGNRLAKELVPNELEGYAKAFGSEGPKTARGIFNLIASVSMDENLQSCRALGEVLRACTEKVKTYREVLCGTASADEWPIIWRKGCRQLCPSWSHPGDLLDTVASTIQASCAAVVREHASELRLDFAMSSEGELEGSQKDAEPATRNGSGHFRGEFADLRRRSELCIHRFDEQLAEIMADIDSAFGDGTDNLACGAAPHAVTASLLASLDKIISLACEEVSVEGTADAFPPLPSQRRGAAHAAVCLGLLLTAASADQDEKPMHLQRLLESAKSAGDAVLAAQANRMLQNIQTKSDAAFRVWARCVVADAAVEFAGTGASLTPSDDVFFQLSGDEVAAYCAWGTTKVQGKTTDSGDAPAEYCLPVPVQASPFVFEKLALAARCVLDVRDAKSTSNLKRSLPGGVVAAIKTALGESFFSVYDAKKLDFDKFNSAEVGTALHAHFNHYLQIAFDLHFIILMLSSPTSRNNGSTGQPDTGSNAYEKLRLLVKRLEDRIFADPVNRLLYPPAIKVAVKSHVQGVALIFAPFLLDNPLYDLRCHSELPIGTPRSQAEGTPHLSSVRRGSSHYISEGEGMQLQASKHQPFREVLARFPLLPVAMGPSLDPNVRRISGDAARRMSFEQGVPGPAVGAQSGGVAGVDTAVAAAASLVQQMGSGLGSLGFGKAFAPIGGSWATGWSAAGSGASGTRPAEAM